MKGVCVYAIRRAVLTDVGGITEVYNEAIHTTVATFDTETKTYESQKEWFLKHGPRSPVLVAVEAESVVGWASLSEWSDRCAYSDTAEVSVYVLEKHRGKGLGRQLLQAILDEGKKAELHTVIARIAEGNEGSVELHKSLGFEVVGTMREVGRKFGKLLDVEILQKIFSS
jgi:phosphinothricin acetyltransferase